MEKNGSKIEFQSYKMTVATYIEKQQVVFWCEFRTSKMVAGGQKTEVAFLI
jgi:hypothetical protein